MKACRNCSSTILSTKRAICWRCERDKYHPAKGVNGRQRCGHCHRGGHNVRTCEIAAEWEMAI